MVRTNDVVSIANSFQSQKHFAMYMVCCVHVLFEHFGHDFAQRSALHPSTFKLWDVAYFASLVHRYSQNYVLGFGADICRLICVSYGYHQLLQILNWSARHVMVCKQCQRAAQIILVGTQPFSVEHVRDVIRNAKVWKHAEQAMKRIAEM
jgi:hypothetical protein